MYAIFETSDLRVSHKAIATVETFEAAEAFLADKFDLIAFDIDPDFDAADAIVKIKNSPCVVQYTVERNG